jgi:hypothetical protein
MQSTHTKEYRHEPEAAGAREAAGAAEAAGTPTAAGPSTATGPSTVAGTPTTTAGAREAGTVDLDKQNPGGLRSAGSDSRKGDDGRLPAAAQPERVPRRGNRARDSAQDHQPARRPDLRKALSTKERLSYFVL